MDQQVKDPKERKSKLRKKAEHRVAAMPPPEGGRTAEELLHELQVHQVELEMQNESLRQSQAELEIYRDRLAERYTDLYEFAPVGYLTLTELGQIAEANLTAASLLGVERKQLLNCRFDLFVAPAERDRCQREFANTRGHGKEAQFDVSVKRADESMRQVHVNCRRVEAGNDQPTLRVALTDISQNTLIAQQLRESEATYRSLFDNMLNGLAYCQMLFENGQPQDFVYLHVNAAFEDQTGLKDVVGKRVSEVIPNIRETDPGLLEIYGRVAQTGSPERFEIYVEALQMWFSISVYSPKQDHFVAVFDVITERKQAEMALQESATRYRTLLDNLPQVVWQKDRNSIYVSCNSAYARSLGIAVEDIQGKTDADFFPSDLAAKYRADDQRIINGNFIETLDERWLKGTEERIAHTTKVPLHDDQGRIYGTLGIAEDITERGQADKALQDQRERTQLLLEFMADGMYGVDTKGICTFVNPAALRLLGYEKADELLGRHLHEIIHHSHADGHPYIRVNDCFRMHQ